MRMVQQQDCCDPCHEGHFRLADHHYGKGEMGNIGCLALLLVCLSLGHLF